MKHFIKLSSKAIALRDENADTDQIIPIRFLKVTTKEGLGQKLFFDWRWDEKGQLLNSVFNDSDAKVKKILIAGPGFGIGSSREHAVWALTDFGFKGLIGSSFGDIFFQNALKNGLMTVKLPENQVKELQTLVEKNPSCEITIDLEKQWVIAPEKRVYEFSIDAFRKKCLLTGVDEIGYVMGKRQQIKEYELRF